MGEKGSKIRLPILGTYLYMEVDRGETAYGAAGQPVFPTLPLVRLRSTHK